MTNLGTFPHGENSIRSVFDSSFVSRITFESHMSSSCYGSYELGPEDVIKFCTECVLSEEEGECDLPKGFYDKPRP
jgi:hypothetical protein